jgi:molecular chaperone DnaJ
MADINEAWRVVGDPARRRQYDLSLTSPTTASERVAEQTVADFVEPRHNPLARYQDPPKFPWRFMAWLLAGGVALVVLGVLTAGDPVPPKVDNVLQPGDCVIIEANGDAAERLCAEPHDATVTVLVTTNERCPDGTEPHRDRQGMGTACLLLN